MKETASLDSAEIVLLRSVFVRHPEVTEVRLFGSRAKGVHANQSDIDLALWGSVSPLRAQTIAAELDELPLPYRYDVVTFDHIKSFPLREHIERVGIPIYQRVTAGGQAVADEQVESSALLFRCLVEGREDFWSVAQRLSRKDLLAILNLGLTSTEGSYRKLSELFHVKREEYKRWMDFIRRRDCVLDPSSFRTPSAIR